VAFVASAFGYTCQCLTTKSMLSTTSAWLLSVGTTANVWL